MSDVEKLERICVDHGLGQMELQDMREFYDSCVDNFMALRTRPGQMSKRDVFELRDAANIFAYMATRNYLREVFGNAALVEALKVKPSRRDYDAEC